jgi:sulfatase maturation enzyme AslB (radical SAM superfamily)
LRNNKYSDYKILGFPDKLKSFEESKVAAPIYVRIKPTNRCNHDCYWCVYADSFRKKNKPDDFGSGHIQSEMHTEMIESDTMPKEKLLETLDIFKEIGVKAVTYSGGGEPLFYKPIVEVMKKTLDHEIDLSIITNGELLNGERAEILSHAKWVRISMDYTNPVEMKNFRRVGDGSFNRVMDNINSFSKIKNSDCDLGINFIVHKDNCNNLVDFATLMKDYGVGNVRFSPMWLPGFSEYHAPFKDIVKSQLKEASKLIDENFTVNSTYNTSDSAHSITRTYKKCFINQIVPVLGADMNIYTCHNKAYDNQGVVGSIKDQDFKSMWFSKETEDFFNKFNPKKMCQHQCSADNKNIILNEYIESSFDNFI